MLVFLCAYHTSRWVYREKLSLDGSYSFLHASYIPWIFPEGWIFWLLGSTQNSFVDLLVVRWTFFSRIFKCSIEWHRNIPIVCWAFVFYNGHHHSCFSVKPIECLGGFLFKKYLELCYHSLSHLRDIYFSARVLPSVFINVLLNSWTSSGLAILLKR